MDIYATIDELQEKALELLQKDDKNRKLLEKVLARHNGGDFENGIRTLKRTSPDDQLVDGQRKGRHNQEFHELEDQIDKLMIKVGALKQLFDEQMNRHCDELKELQDEIEKLMQCIIKISSLT